jgi:hypothetical protein
VADLAIGSVFAGYRIESVAGRGGMGIVYRATDLELDRTVALKCLASALAEDSSFRDRFIVESRTAASIDHPNVIPIFRAGEHDGTLFLAMRYVDGDDLRNQIREQGRLDPNRAAAIIAQVAAALDVAHGHGLVHRDVKPANVLLADDDHAYLTDFGLTKRALGDPEDTVTGELLGSLNYVAPEQIRGEKAEPRTDVYALGCMLYHALTGSVPFRLEGHEAKLWAHISEAPPSPSGACPELPAAFDEVIACAMAKQADDRYGSAGDLGRAALAAAGSGASPPARSPHRFRAALLRRALLHPFNLAVLGTMLAVAVAIDRLEVLGAIALGIYAVAVVVTWLDEDVRLRVAQQRPAEQPPSPSRTIGELLSQAGEKESRIRATIARAELPYAEVSQEVDRLIKTMRETAERAELLHEGLEDTPTDTVERRLMDLRRRGDPGKQDLARALEQQLEVQRRAERQLHRFYDQMEEVLVELDTVRGHVITSSTEPVIEERVAAEVRDLRAGMAPVAVGVAEAFEERTGSYPHFGTEGT